MSALCGSHLRMPDGGQVPCTLDYDHLERHQMVVRGVVILVWSHNDNGTGTVVGGAMAQLFRNGAAPIWGEDVA
jgi:hypothetical protein